MLLSTLRTHSERAFFRLFSNDCDVKIERDEHLYVTLISGRDAQSVPGTTTLCLSLPSQTARISLLSIPYLNNYKYIKDIYLLI